MLCNEQYHMGGTAHTDKVNFSGADFANNLTSRKPPLIEYLLPRVYDEQHRCVSLRLIAQIRQQGVGVEQPGENSLLVVE
jgi:hypothetical protein